VLWAFNYFFLDSAKRLVDFNAAVALAFEGIKLKRPKARVALTRHQVKVCLSILVAYWEANHVHFFTFNVNYAILIVNHKLNMWCLILCRFSNLNSELGGMLLQIFIVSQQRCFHIWFMENLLVAFGTGIEEFVFKPGQFKFRQSFM
jgi:hypothetical protein